ncbi:fatty acid desaturase [Verminephrobacter aporrectodeae]|uniref:fatty acid desaturase n=1 Tax=Verminephrobacter aporrectodeae TaxID=1110389 RepID=UPI0022385D91|nr:fatty acid desaturase [Verminephrobacter aporrectodeae]
MEPRETYRVLPSWSSWFWTWLTGVPLEGERPLLVHSAKSFLLMAATSYIGGIALSIGGVMNTGGWSWVSMITGWCLVVSGARRLVSTVVHQCIHGRFSGWRKIDYVIGELLTVLTFTQTAEEYRREHFEKHHRFGIFSTKDDPSVQFLMKSGFKPGMSVKALWIRLLLNIFSPKFHLYFITQRIRSNFVHKRPMRLVMVYVYLLIWGGALVLGWVSQEEIFFGVIVPIIFLYQISVMLEFVSEHAWLVPTQHVGHARSVHYTHSWARFCGSATPMRSATHSATSYYGCWLVWWSAQLLYHIPVRLLVLPGDLPQHDFHHRSPNTTEWPNAAYARQQHLQKNKEPSMEFWGLHRAINHVFLGIAITGANVARAPIITSNQLSDVEGSREC